MIIELNLIYTYVFAFDSVKMAYNLFLIVIKRLEKSFIFVWWDYLFCLASCLSTESKIVISSYFK